MIEGLIKIVLDHAVAGDEGAAAQQASSYETLK
jgi:hypothetical protein